MTLRRMAIAIVITCGLLAGASCQQATSSQAAQASAVEAPRDWIDPATGHRIVQLSGDEGGGSLYFHQNSYLVDGGELVMTAPGRIVMVNIPSRETRILLEDASARLLFTGRKTRSVYYSKPLDGGGREYLVLDPDTLASRRVTVLDKGMIGSINADETLLLGQVELAPAPSSSAPGYPHAVGPDGKQLTFAETREVRLDERLEARTPMEIFTIDLRTGERKVVRVATDWLNHIQFSPTDPGLIMFCHEGPWHKVDRIWTMRTDGSELTKIHTRTMNMEIAGHEFFSPDGRTIWYDLQTPRGQKFWLSAYNLDTGKRTWLHLERDEWSVHFNISPDGSLFLGDGGDAEMVAHAPDGKWIYLFRPEVIPDVAGIHAPNADELIVPGILRSEKLVDMRRHDYRLEPNATFTPDGKWIVFNGNMHGKRHVYAVEVARRAEPAPVPVAPLAE